MGISEKERGGTRRENGDGVRKREESRLTEIGWGNGDGVRKIEGVGRLRETRRGGAS